MVLVFPAAPLLFEPNAFVDDFFGCGADAWVGVAQEGPEMAALLAVDSSVEVDTLLHVVQCLADLQFLRAEFEAFATEVPTVSLSRELLVGLVVPQHQQKWPCRFLRFLRFLRGICLLCPIVCPRASLEQIEGDFVNCADLPGWASAE